MLLPASFWRGGTSKGLILRARDLARYTPDQRDHIIYTALGSGDARQIDGLGGGVSSLSKVAIIGEREEGLGLQRKNGILPGVAWADTGSFDCPSSSYDVVYRFAQVSIKEKALDWSATCGNMLAAVAMASVESVLSKSLLRSRSESLPRSKDQPILFPISILSASNGILMRATVPLDPTTLEIWHPLEGQGTSIAGVPGEAVGISLEMPLGGQDAGLVTGRSRDVIMLDGKEIPCSILSAGLPNIFVDISSLDLPSSLIGATSSVLSSHPTLLPLLERLRTCAAQQFSIPISLASPKIILVARMPSSGYTTSSYTEVEASEADLFVLSTSSGQIHATIPGTTLAAVNVGAGIKGTLIQDIIGVRTEEVVTVRCAHAAGVASSSARFVLDEQERRRAVGVVLMRTAREIMRGDVCFSLPRPAI